MIKTISRFNLLLLTVLLFGFPSMAISDVATGRSQLFHSGSSPNGEPTYTGICSANAEFEEAVTSNPSDQEANLFYAVTRLPAFVLESGSGSEIETIRDMLEAYGITRNAFDSLEESPFNDPPSNPDGSYNLPGDTPGDAPGNAPDGKDVQDFLVDHLIVEVDGAIGNLNSINYTTSTIVTLTATETGDAAVEVDYGDVLLYKSSLYFLKFYLSFISAYNLDLDTNELEWHTTQDFIHNIQEFLDYYPDFLKLYGSGTGTALLDDARVAFVNSITTSEEAFNFIAAESDDQANDLFYFGSSDAEIDMKSMLSYLNEIKSSINGNRPAVLSRTKSYWGLTFDDDSGKTLCIGMEEDLDGNIPNIEIESDCSSESNFPFYYRWEDEGYVASDGTLYFSVDGNTGEPSWNWGTAELTGTIVGSNINGSYTINSAGGTSTGTFTGSRQSDETETFRIDFNLLFGNTGKPPLDIRAMMPTFDANDEIICGTFPGDPVVNGILPDYLTNGTISFYICDGDYGDDDDDDDDDIVVEDPPSDIVDRNNDGIADSEQPNVKSVDTYNDQGIVTFESESNTTISNYSNSASGSTIYPAPDGVEFPYGFFSFTVSGISVGGSTTVKIILPASAIVNTYYKFGRTPDNGADHWYEFLYDGETETGAVISGNEITLHFKDGMRGDRDLDDSNGTIVDPCGPGMIDTGFETPAGTNGGGGGGGGCFISNLSK